MNVYKANFYGLGDALPAEDELGNLIREGIAVNSTAFLDYSDPGQIKALGNPTEGALLLWLHGQGVNYLDLRETRAFWNSSLSPRNANTWPPLWTLPCWVKKYCM